MSCCQSPNVITLDSGKRWCATCDHEESEPEQSEKPQCCKFPNITSTTYTDSCSNCGWYYNYIANKEGRN